MCSVGMLSIASVTAVGHVIKAFKQGMRDLGWIEGQNVEYRLAFADGDVQRLERLAGELVGQKVDVIVVGNPQATRAAQRATTSIPIVMTNVSNAVDNRFVTSLAKPGGNITGVTSQLETVLGKLIEIFHEVAPGAKRIAVLLNETSPSHRAFWKGAQSACAALDLVALRVVANAPAQVDAAVAQIVHAQAQAVAVVADPMFVTEREKLEVLMRATRLPVAYGLREHVVAGGLLSYASNLARNYQYAATYVDKILKGARPADLPVQQPTRFELVLNLKTAKALGLNIPQPLLLRADEVIE
jgi:putative ABC transport system substrate-binding protein